MTIDIIRIRRCLSLAVLALGVASGAAAQDKPWPSRPIRYIVPYPAGGPTDVLSRQITTHLQEALGQPVIVENIAGAGGVIGQRAIAAAPADGYTIGYGPANMAINPHLHPASFLKYDAVKDFTPVALLVEAANVVIVNPKEPYRTLADLIAAGKAKPGTIAYGSAGSGTGGHLAVEMLAAATGAQFLHVPYKGNAAAQTDLIGGNISFMLSLPIDAVPLAREGKVRALATTHRKRMEIDPSIPTVAETVPGFEVVLWGAVIGPAGMPEAVTRRLTDEIARILRKPDVVDRLTRQGWEVAYGTPEDAARVIRRDLARWGPVVKASGAKPD